MCSMLEVYLRIRRRHLILGLQPGPNPMVCVLKQGKLQTGSMDGMQLQMEEKGRFMAGRRVMVDGGSRRRMAHIQATHGRRLMANGICLTRRDICLLDGKNGKAISMS